MIGHHDARRGGDVAAHDGADVVLHAELAARRPIGVERYSAAMVQSFWSVPRPSKFSGQCIPAAFWKK